MRQPPQLGSGIPHLSWDILIVLSLLKVK
jgi:hypothetical protein